MTVRELAPAKVAAPRGRRTAVLVVAAVAFLGFCWWFWPAGYVQSDLRVYVVAARAFLHGQDIYTAHLAFPKELALGFTYPPFAALVFTPVAALGTGTGRVVMTLVNASCLLAIGVLMTRALRPAWSRERVLALGFGVGALGLTLEPVRSTFALGQVNLILLVLLLVDLLGRTPRRFRGVLIGVATGIKLTPGIFILYLLVTRRFREAAVAIGTTAGTMLIGVVVMPDASRQFWTHYIFDPSRPGPTHFISNQAWRGVFARVAGGVEGIGPIWLLAVALTVAVGCYAARRLDRLDGILVTALVGLLVSPISWSGHWVWALPICAVLWFRRRSALAMVWTVVTVFGFPWLAPNHDDREYHLHGFGLVLGNAYAVLAAITILHAAYVQSDSRSSSSSTRSVRPA
ncbi:glycosyltransferase 87 family protein [Kribbella soli]|uniref:DUF2029 domain-containing protein n=1 Tax=Kribbella soli TaxID=1124743 RepID=A0A4R0H2X1_9ACTN|nr:glycosyltransferase 87 family protein [Kribbella soli]TCC03938.1 DUF2029 domain-containing protein [Kribbella soli]